MEYSETEKQMLREILPGIATQLRGSLANIHAALGRLAPEQARDASTDTDRSAAILCQSYYRILRVVNNLSDAPMLAEEKPLDTENVELVRFLDGLCRQGEALAQLVELRLTFTCPERAHTVAVNREYLARLLWTCRPMAWGWVCLCAAALPRATAAALWCHPGRGRAPR